MLFSAKSVNSSSFSYSIFTYKMSTHAVTCFFEVVVHCQNRLIAGLFLDNGKRKSATRESLADDFKRIIL